MRAIIIFYIISSLCMSCTRKKLNVPDKSLSFIDSIEVERNFGQKINALQSCRLIYYLHSDCNLSDSNTVFIIPGIEEVFRSTKVDKVKADSMPIIRIKVLLDEDKIRFESIKSILSKYPTLIRFNNGRILSNNQVVLDSISTNPSVQIQFWLEGDYVISDDSLKLNEGFYTDTAALRKSIQRLL